MQDYVLYYRTVAPTGRELGKALGVKYGSNPSRISEPVRMLVRWGSQLPFRSELQLNPPSAMALASDKFRALDTLAKAGVLVPPFSRLSQELSGTILGRRRTGFGGRDIVVYEPGSQVGVNHEFFSQYIPNSREYRIHVVRGEIIRVQGKYLDNPQDESSGFIKNHANGYRFRDPGREINKDRKEAAIESVKALGLDFGAVDLIVGMDKKCYVLEVNTAPSCSPLTLSKYVEAFKKLGVRESTQTTVGSLPASLIPTPSVRPSRTTKYPEGCTCDGDLRYGHSRLCPIRPSEPRRVEDSFQVYNPLSYEFRELRIPYSSNEVTSGEGRLRPRSSSDAHRVGGRSINRRTPDRLPIRNERRKRSTTRTNVGSTQRSHTNQGRLGRKLPSSTPRVSRRIY